MTRTARADLARVSTATLERLREALVAGRLRAPLTRADLVAAGIRHQVEALAVALEGHSRLACETILDVALAERAARQRPAPELVWTGPEGNAATARDTAVVLRELFEAARERVVLGGYSFSHARGVLAPLYRVMADHGVTATFIVNIEQVERRGDVREVPEDHAADQLEEFIADNWPFGAPYPRLYYDPRALAPGPPWCSMHAKCVVIDDACALVSSANFTQRGQERNIEAGVLLRDPAFAAHLAGQWQGLIEAGLVTEWKPSGERPDRG